MAIQAKTLAGPGLSLPRLKICGVTRAEDLRAACAAGVTYVGFNFHPGSKRFIPPAEAARLWREVATGTTQAVGVVVNAPDLRAILEEFPELAILQAHGDETPARLAADRAALGGRGLWKAIRVASADDVQQADAFLGGVDLVLFDAKAPKSAEYGGTGHKFPWAWLAGRERGFGLAGGIGPGDLAQAASTGAALIDVCSGVESAPGIKDSALIERLAEEWRRLA